MHYNHAAVCVWWLCSAAEGTVEGKSAAYVQTRNAQRTAADQSIYIDLSKRIPPIQINIKDVRD
jgi:hypothetical protein